MCVEQREELLRYKNYYNKNPLAVERKKVKLCDIEFDKENIKKLLSRQARKKRQRYCYDDGNSDAADDEADVQSDDYDGERSDSKSNDEKSAAAKK